jgi:CTP:molybdopterin cytidylyltransferase MocA
VATAGLLLAAGGGRRYGMPKALAVRDGRLWVEWALDVLLAAGCDPVVVVLGAGADEVRRRAALAGATVVDNPDWPSGMGSSLRLGLTTLSAVDSATAVVVLLVDTPGVTAEAARRLASHADPGALAVATYHGRTGHPVLLGRDHWAGVAALATGDTGARAYLRGNADRVRRVPCEDVADGVTDIDEPG